MKTGTIVLIVKYFGSFYGCSEFICKIQVREMNRNNYTLKTDAGIPGSVIFALAVIAGVSVANLYYNQPLLETIRQDLDITITQSSRITLFTQMGYALGLFFIIPLADLVSRKKIIISNFLILLFSLMAIAVSSNIYVIHAASIVTGACSVIPQLFVPLTAQYSLPVNKERNVGIILSGLLSGILVSRVISGAVGELWGWRTMYFIASGLMVVSCIVILMILPPSETNFKGRYSELLKSIFVLYGKYPEMRIGPMRAGLMFGSFMCFWASLAFMMAEEPFCVGSDIVGLLGLCGLAGTITASTVGKYVPRYGVVKFNIAGAVMGIAAWLIFMFVGGSYVALILGIILIDIGSQFIQLSNQSTLFRLEPSASNRINTIFMTTFFIGGALGTFLSSFAWEYFGWTGVCISGISLTAASLAITLFTRKRMAGNP